jgi:hypothetical protein
LTVSLHRRQVAILDRLAVEIRLNGSFGVSRSDLIRGIIEAAVRSGVNLSYAGNEEEIAEMLHAAWRSKRKAAR